VFEPERREKDDLKKIPLGGVLEVEKRGGGRQQHLKRHRGTGKEAKERKVERVVDKKSHFT